MKNKSDYITPELQVILLTDTLPSSFPEGRDPGEGDPYVDEDA